MEFNSGLKRLTEWKMGFVCALACTCVSSHTHTHTHTVDYPNINFMPQDELYTFFLFNFKDFSIHIAMLFD
jgi:hypothetical protein